MPLTSGGRRYTAIYSLYTYLYVLVCTKTYYVHILINRFTLCTGFLGSHRDKDKDAMVQEDAEGDHEQCPEEDEELFTV